MAPGVVIERVATPEELAEALALRLVVFVVEQGCPEWEELDDTDLSDATTHVIARDLDSGDVLGTGRLITDPATPGEVRIGRIAVAAPARRSGIGAALMSALEDIARREYASSTGTVTVFLNAQVQAGAFYEALGYQLLGPIYEDAGIDHRDAIKLLTASEGGAEGN